MPPDRAQSLTRIALQLAGQLPDDIEDALAVIEFTRELVSDFLAPEQKEGATPRPGGLGVVRDVSRGA